MTFDPALIQFFQQGPLLGDMPQTIAPDTFKVEVRSGVMREWCGGVPRCAMSCREALP
jgi:hypothetical protein